MLCCSCNAFQLFFNQHYKIGNKCMLHNRLMRRTLLGRFTFSIEQDNSIRFSMQLLLQELYLYHPQKESANFVQYPWFTTSHSFRCFHLVGWPRMFLGFASTVLQKFLVAYKDMHLLDQGDLDV